MNSKCPIQPKTVDARPSTSLIARKAAARMVVKTGIRAAAEQCCKKTS